MRSWSRLFSGPLSPVAPCATLLLILAGCGGGATLDRTEAASAEGSEPPETGFPDAVYYVYAGAESADLLHRIRLGPEGAEIDATTPVGEMAVETEGPHGLATSPDGEYVYMTTGHGVPDGKLWKFRAGPDTLVAEPILLGRFPATLDLTPDGLYAFVVNFNLHGERVPSSVSVVYTPDMVEVKQIETCVMPHGLRIAPDGLFAYSNCMMNDLLVEIDTRTFEVSRTFRVAEGEEGPGPVGPLPAEGISETGGMPGEAALPMSNTCSPTWAEPSADGGSVFVACNKGDWIVEVDRESWSVVRRIPTSMPGPYNLDVSADGSLLIATLKPSHHVELFELESGESLGVLPSSTTIPHGVVISPDSRFAFTTAEGVGAEPGKVDVFSLRPFERIASLPVGQQAGGITFWKMEPASVR